MANAAFGYWLSVWNVCRGLLYLLYPVCGWIAEVYSSNFKFIKWSIITSLLASIVSCISELVRILFVKRVISYARLLCSIVLSIGGLLRMLSIKYFHSIIHADEHPEFGLVVAISIASTLISLNMYEANAIQFGMDQMIEASSQQLSSFIHWYFWCAHAAALVPFYITVILIYVYVGDCNIGKKETEGIDCNVIDFLSYYILFINSISLITVWINSDNLLQKEVSH